MIFTTKFHYWKHKSIGFLIAHNGSNKIKNCVGHLIFLISFYPRDIGRVHSEYCGPTQETFPHGAIDRRRATCPPKTRDKKPSNTIRRKLQINKHDESSVTETVNTWSLISRSGSRNLHTGQNWNNLMDVPVWEQLIIIYEDYRFLNRDLNIETKYLFSWIIGHRVKIDILIPICITIIKFFDILHNIFLILTDFTSNLNIF